MSNLLPLNSLKIGTSGIIHSIQSTGSMRRRLLDLGFCEGTPVRCIQASPAGDPIAYGIRGTIIALRNEDAGQILIYKGGSTWD